MSEIIFLKNCMPFQYLPCFPYKALVCSFYKSLYLFNWVIGEMNGYWFMERNFAPTIVYHFLYVVNVGQCGIVGSVVRSYTVFIMKVFILLYY